MYIYIYIYIYSYTYAYTYTPYTRRPSDLKHLRQQLRLGRGIPAWSPAGRKSTKPAGV